MGFLITVLLAFVTGLMGAVAFPSLDWFILLFPSLIGLLESVRIANRFDHKTMFRITVGLFWGLAFFGFQLTWLTIPASSVIPWISLVFLQALFICLFSEVWGRGEILLDQCPRWFWPLKLLWAPLAWTAVEQLRSLVPFNGFPWSKLAFALVDSPLLVWAPWGGSIAVGGVAVFLSVVILFAVRASQWQRFLSVILAIGVVALPFLVSSPYPQVIGDLRVAAVQGNTPGRDPQTAFGQPGQTLQRHVNESLRLASVADEVDLVLWPENAADLDPRVNSESARALQDVSQAFAAPILTGTLGNSDFGDDSAFYNTILYWDKGKVRDSYSKTHLVPFGEYLPWRGFFEKVVPSFTQLVKTDLKPGSSVAQLRVQAGGRDFTVASPVCYEIADDALVRQAVSGAAFLYIPTSNSFFGSSDQAKQQLAIARFRAAEHGLDTVQVSTMDSTAQINPRGELIGRVLGNFETGSLEMNIGLRRGGLTPASLFGGVVQIGVLVFFVIAVLVIFANALKEKWSDDGGH